MGFRENNIRERMKFFDLWAEYVRTHSDREWSRQQNVIINPTIRPAWISKEDYLRMKGERV